MYILLVMMIFLYLQEPLILTLAFKRLLICTSKIRSNQWQFGTSINQKLKAINYQCAKQQCQPHASIEQSSYSFFISWVIVKTRSFADLYIWFRILHMILTPSLKKLSHENQFALIVLMTHKPQYWCRFQPMWNLIKYNHYLCW